MRNIRISATLLVAGIFVVLGDTSVQAQPGRGGAQWFGGGGGGGSIGLLMREDVRKELEIVDEQQEKLRAAGEKLREDMRDMFSGLRDLPDEERRERFAELREKMREKTEQLQTEVDKILLPHQRSRLKQIHTQMQMRSSGTTANLSGGKLAEELKITDEQKEKLKQIQVEVQKELNEKISKARAEAKEKLLDVLTPEQREKFKTMMGDDFQFEQRRDDRRGGSRGRRPDSGDSRDST